MREASVEYAIELMSYLPNRPDYSLWIKIISALYNTFGYSAAKDIALMFWNDEKKFETEKKIKHSLQRYNFGTLVHYAKEYGFDSKTQKKEFVNKVQKMTNRPIDKKIYNVSTPNKLIYIYKDVEANQYFNKLLAEGVEEYIACQKTNNLYPDSLKERAYRICINLEVKNKNMTKDGIPHKDFTPLNSLFQNVQVTKNDLIQIITKGYPVIFAKMDTLNYKNRCKESFLGAELFGIDVDNKNKDKSKMSVEQGYKTFEEALNNPITKDSMFVYTTPTHTDEWHRYRLVFPLSKFIEDAEILKLLIKDFIKLYNSDENTSSEVQVFYGNDNAKLFVTDTGELIQFKNGIATI